MNGFKWKCGGIFWHDPNDPHPLVIHTFEFTLEFEAGPTDSLLMNGI